ncbi:valyl-tRNA synthetase [Salpingoeca rosetta]|uniref:valine--tRNA ligase n=1 Tax=Salpingoeca rosetta (strain ATCC 50818 / BSB-021) TaxID=946362 RepID=F2UFH3_SALR5|nr:valyl-tRNA synthetase [Salpingoeca rosetta]EGD75541.1 valyl-tRNA synthetase [Salpingoeca rosetta]|eukprot:XP_004991998.1 valyl-tRNA synthetase [Salpingoeca rosetta]
MLRTVALRSRAQQRGALDVLKVESHWQAVEKSIAATAAAAATDGVTPSDAAAAAAAAASTTKAPSIDSSHYNNNNNSSSSSINNNNNNDDDCSISSRHGHRDSAAEVDNRFVMMFPPPNVTGSLHLGHALTIAVQDALARWSRMRGLETTWVPGVDHAGIATQTVVEKQVHKQEGLTRHDLGRDAFLGRVWQWKEDRAHDILEQARGAVHRMGASLDWSRMVFTLDDKFTRATKTAFVRLFDRGLIQRRNHCINWSCTLQSAISDMEVDSLPVEGRTSITVPGYNRPVVVGQMYDVFFPLADDPTGEQGVVVSTTRPETMPGDVAVAVHPDDPRYVHLHNRHLRHPLTGAAVPVITDSLLVDPALGTGAVKITPAHDPNDHEAGLRHNLPSIQVMDKSGHMDCPELPSIHGQHRFDARITVLKALEESGHLRQTRDHKTTVPVCSRSGDVIEPLVCPQWFLDCTNMAEKALSEYRSGNLQFHPARMGESFERWLSSIRPWCISRQLWWGHRIPAYHATWKVGQSNTPVCDWVAACDENAARQRAARHFGISTTDDDNDDDDDDDDGLVVVQDEDVLDTWFSSALYPFAAFGWPDTSTEDFRSHYPTNVLETGHDILFFWVARMVMLGLELTDTLPFKEVVLHAMVRDAKGRKMSKSLGNVIDPLDVVYGSALAEEMIAKLHKGNLDARELKEATANIEKEFPKGIPSCGADALRFALCAYTTQGRDINLNINRVVAAKSLCNKLWNAVGYVNSKLPAGGGSTPSAPNRHHRMNVWIVQQLHATARVVDAGFRTFDFAAVTTALHDFWIKSYCDVYLEWTKAVLSDASMSEQHDATLSTLVHTARCALTLLAPIMPHIAQELYTQLPRHEDDPDHLIFGPFVQPPRDDTPASSSSSTSSSSPSSSPSSSSSSDGAVVREVDDVLALVSSVRSCPLVQRYQGPAAQRPRALIVCTDPADTTDWQHYRHVLLSLCTIRDVSFVSSNDIPSTALALPTTSPRHKVFVELYALPSEGAINKEIAQLNKKMAKDAKRLQQLRTSMQRDGYADRTPPDVQLSHREQESRLAAQVSSGETAVHMYTQLLQSVRGRQQQ